MLEVSRNTLKMFKMYAFLGVLLFVYMAGAIARDFLAPKPIVPVCSCTCRHEAEVVP